MRADALTIKPGQPFPIVGQAEFPGRKAQAMTLQRWRKGEDHGS
jgi:hypothetical protein